MSNLNVVNSNVAVKASAMTSVIYQKGVSPKEAMILAATLIECQKDMEFGEDIWLDAMEDGIYNAVMTVAGEDRVGLIINNWKGVLVSCDLITEDCKPGPYLLKLDEVKPKARPMPASATRIARNRPIKGFKSKLMVKAIEFAQATPYMVDTWIMEVADEVFGDDQHAERYVIDGCKVLVAEGNVAVTSEFFDDTRGRLYQADCHGPNGQSSDLARALMDLSGVAQDYDEDAAVKIIMDEIADMISCTYEEAVMAWKAAGSTSKFIKMCLGDELPAIKKPWSFVKAVRIMKQVQAGKKPYIGMAFGLDAKCSGPQLGALMTNDGDIARACGFASLDENLDDAYKKASDNCAKAGFGTIPRGVIKKPYMGIFYGQGKGAFQFADSFDEKDADSMALLEIIKKGPGSNLEENGELFHQAVERSFGNMLALRRAIRKAHYTFDDDMNMVMLTNKATKHFMPDGTEVTMNYKEMLNIDGEKIGYGDVVPDVQVKLGLTDLKFNEMKFRTNVVSLYDYARTGFVNLIQATDALLARLIISHLEDLGATHVIAVHDCFRVNINDMIDGKLHKAIELAYMDLFGNKDNEATELLPYGTDILALYFQGVNRAGAEVANAPSQFAYNRRTDSNKRIMKHIGGKQVADLICDLSNALDGTGSTYFFAK